MKRRDFIKKASGSIIASTAGFTLISLISSCSKEDPDPNNNPNIPDCYYNDTYYSNGFYFDGYYLPQQYFEDGYYIGNQYFEDGYYKCI